MALTFHPISVWQPPPRTEIVVCAPGFKPVGAFLNNDSNWTLSGGATFAPTHWAEVPPPDLLAS